MKPLQGKVAIVTGASSPVGIGAAVARRLAGSGAKLLLVADDSPDAVASECAALLGDAGGVVPLTADLGDADAVLAMVAEAEKRFGRIDLLVNNAGALVKRVPIDQFTDEIFDDVVDVNVRSALAATSAAVPLMRAQGGGNVIFVTSIAARHGGGPGASIYAGSKAFVSSATRGLAKELAKDRIRVNAVSPGVITTPFHEKFSTPEQLESMRLTIPMARLGTADECVGAFVYFASERLSGYVTGQILEVNGGQYMP
jgi:3-oxoacyl-[acyl-carrier protein] reductase